MAPSGGALSGEVQPTRPPNVLLIVADDLGVGELGCYGQRIIRTPTLNALARDGMRFTAAYAGSCVCAPSRCTLLTGLHTGRAAIRDNRELSPTGQEPLPEESVTLAELLRPRGYATAAIGKWGLGAAGSSGDPARQGFDRFFGYYCQRHAHNHCPTHLFRDGVRVELPGNTATPPNGLVAEGVYAPDLFREEAIGFIRQHADRPFFLLFATTVPHAALQVPEESLGEYRGAFEDPPYVREAGRDRGYLAHPTPRAAYAAMFTRLDRDIGAILAEIDALGLARDTIVVFTSDNGPTFNGGTDSAFFASSAGRRGLKCELYEGGIRVPLLVRWPGRISAGSLGHDVVAAWDLLPTIAAACGVDRATWPTTLDGVDLGPVLLGMGPLPGRDHLYWEYHAGGGWQAVRIGRWKGVRRKVTGRADAPIELYDLEHDAAEHNDVAAQHPEIVARMEAIMRSRSPSPVAAWNFGG